MLTIDPFASLKDVFTRLPADANWSIRELSPGTWAAAQGHLLAAVAYRLHLSNVIRGGPIARKGQALPCLRAPICTPPFGMDSRSPRHKGYRRLKYGLFDAISSVSSAGLAHRSNKCSHTGQDNLRRVDSTLLGRPVKRCQSSEGDPTGSWQGP